MPAAQKFKMTKTQYKAEMAKHEQAIQKHNAVLNGPNGLHNKIHLDATNAVIRSNKQKGIKSFFVDDREVEKQKQAHKDYPKYKKHLEALTKARKAADNTYEKFHGKKFDDREYRDARSSMLTAKMKIIAGEKVSSNLNRKFHKNMMRHHRREGNHHLAVENKLTAMAEKHRNKVGAYKPEGEAYKKEAEFHAGRVQHHANKYQMHKKAMKAIPEGRKKGSK